MISRNDTAGQKLLSTVPDSLETERLILKQYQLPDWQDWASLRKQSKSMLQPWEPTWSWDVLSKKSFKKRVDYNLENWQKDKSYALLCWRKEDDVLVGGVTLSDIRRSIYGAGILGYWCGRPFLRQGYTFEAVQRTIEFAFTDLNLQRLGATCMPENIGSLALLEKAGFRKEGLARGLLKICGEWRDHELHALLKEDVLPS